LGKLRSAVYARMEEMSFRSGAAVGAGTLAAAAAGTAIALAVTLTGHSAATGGVGLAAPARPEPAPSAPSAVTPSVTPSATPSATPVTRSSPTASPQGYQPVSLAPAVTTPQATSQPAVRLGPPRRPHLRMHPASINMGEPIPLAHPFGATWPGLREGMQGLSRQPSRHPGHR
jgi:hypothetical protein